MASDGELESAIVSQRAVVHRKGMGEVFGVLPHVGESYVHPSLAIVLEYGAVDCPVEEVVGVTNISAVVQ